MKTRSLIQIFFRLLLGLFLAFAGFSHLTFNRIAFQAQVPTWLPMNKDLVVILSGVVEILLGLCFLILGKKKRLVGIAGAIFFILVFPGNISQYLNRIDSFGLNSDNLRLIRLFFQPLLVIWALWSTGGLAIRGKQNSLKEIKF